MQVTVQVTTNGRGTYEITREVRDAVRRSQVREGLAHAMSVPPDRRHAERLLRAEEAARADGLGMWSLPRPTPLPVFGTPWP